ncbi:hypothetical protein [Ruminococcus sp.]|uniref:hypothetical protein n=1 Tax=Ruminococcus sp. TaxID=41978 RepID=UPI002E7944F0|nr:hypothetical protein [Ruminococcus sp.]MEE1263355.1 hypothetical protein [Ruminococcus sp.]
MKKIVILAAAAFVAAVTAFSATASAGSSNTYIKGDADGNGTVNVNDVTAVQRVLAELDSDSDGKITKRADIDGGGLSISDATAIQYYLADLSNKNNIGEEIVETPKTTRHPYELPFIPIN